MLQTHFHQSPEIAFKEIWRNGNYGTKQIIMLVGSVVEEIEN